jgi:hypothetical protein
MDELRIHQLMKEMVAEELRQLGDPCKTAAEVVRRALVPALQSSPEGTTAERIIEDSVKGAMTALLLAEQNLPRGTLLVLEVVLETSTAHLDPTVAMSAALKGVADLRRFADVDRLEEIRQAVDKTYMGAGELFNELLRQPLPGGQTPTPR